MNAKNVFVFAANDRFNYGDLLFPYVVELMLSKESSGKFKFDFFGLVDSDLTSLGGKPTRSVRKLNLEIEKNPGASVIIAGGEVVGQGWDGLYFCINKSFAWFRNIKFLWKYNINYDRLAKMILGGRTTFPYLVNPDVFSNAPKVIYNSIGGIDLATQNTKRKKIYINELKNSKYLSLRESVSVAGANNLGLNASLVPDSAIVMQKYLSDKMREGLRTQIRSHIESLAGNFVVFQVSRHHTQKKNDVIINELEKISAHYGYTIVLCPIGRALGHEDQIPLMEISKRLNCPNHIFEDLNIWEIMYVIGSSKLYMGTSLHGAITAMSFGVPYLGLNKKIYKLDSYLQTWGVDQINSNIEFSEMFEKAKIALSIENRVLEISRDKQIELVEESFKKISEIILN